MLVHSLSRHSRAARLAAVLFVLLVSIGAFASAAQVLPSPSSGSSTSTPSATAPASSASSFGTGTIVISPGQSTSVSEVLPNSGTGPYSWQWLYSTDGGASYQNATTEQCATPRGTGGPASANETCSFTASSSTALGTYLFELKVTDSASTPESIVLGASQSITVQSGGTSPSHVGPPQFDTEPAEYCSVTCTTSNWFGGAHGSGALNLTTAAANELLLLEITDATQTGSGLTTADISDTQGSTWVLLSSHSWNGTGSVQYIFRAIDPTAGADTVTVDSAAGSLTSAGNATAVLSAFSGVNTASPIAATGTFASSTGTSALSSVTVNVAPTTIVGLVSTANGAASFVTTSGYASAGTINDLHATASFMEYLPTLSSGTYTSSPSWTNSVAWGAEAIAIEGASPLSVTVSPTAYVLDQGQQVTLTATATGGTGSLTYTWSVQSGSCPGFANSGVSTLTYTPSSTTSGCVLTVTVVDANSDTVQPATPASITVNSTLVAPAAPTVSATALDFDQSLTTSGTTPTTGTSPYAWAWLVSTNGGAYAAMTKCGTNSGSGAAAGAVENCVVAASTLTVGNTYALELRVTDSATVGVTVTSMPSPTVTVKSAFTAPAAPGLSAAKLDVNQSLTVTATIPNTGTPTYSWQWLVRVNSGSYAGATQCAINSGSGASGGTVETCAIPANTLTAGDSYNFELQVVDSATSPETKTSGASAACAVKSALTAPSTPNPSVTSLPATSPLTVTATVPSTGTPNYAWQWLISVNAGAYVAATQCAVNSGVNAGTGATETCSIAGNTLTASTNYNFELRVTDSASSPETETSAASSTVATTSALTAGTPTPTAPTIDSGQTVTLTANPSGGTPAYSYQWYSGSSAAACTGLTSPIAGATQPTYGANPTSATFYCYVVTDSLSATSTSATAEVLVNAALDAPAAPTVTATILDQNQATSLTDTIPTTGTGPYQYEWLVSTGGSYAKATVCSTPSGSGATGSTVETCSIGANALVAGDTYTFEFLVNDSAYAPSTVTSTASSGIVVSTALTAPVAPTVNAPKLDVDQALTVTGTIPTSGSPTYSWQWLVSVNSGAYSNAALCGTNSGSGASAGATEICAIGANTLTVGSTYAFELKVTDGATVPEVQTSPASATVTVKAALTPPAVPTVSVTALDLDQAMTVTDNIPATGTSSYSWQWLVSVNGGAYSASTVCSANSGSGAGSGALETCSIAANTLTANSTYSFEFRVTDGATTPETTTSSFSATVTARPALTAPAAPTVSATKLDVDEVLTVQGTIPLTGTSPYSWQWQVSVNGAAYATATQCAVNGGSSASGGAVETCSIAANTLTVGDTYAFKLKVTDSAATAESKTSAASATVTVKSALTAPALPTPSASVIDADQALSVTATIPSSGSSPYSWQWLVSVGGGSFVAATQCSSNSGSGGAAGAVKTCSIAGGTLTAGTTYAFEFQVTDSAGPPETQTSPTSTLVTVNSAFVAPTEPTVSATRLDVDQALTVTGTIPTAGTPPYQYEWLSSTGGAYSKATICAAPSGTGATGGTVETCLVAANALTAGITYWFKLLVNDSATVSDSAKSPASSSVAVATALSVPAAPTVSASGLDVDQVLTVSGAIPSTGTPSYSWQWLVSVNGASYVAATQCTVSNGSSATADSPETCTIAGGTLSAAHTYTFKLQVTDNATSNETQPSSASPTVTVSSSVSGGSPTPPSPAIDVGQSITLTATPSGGSGGYTYQWYSGSTAAGCTALGSPILGATSSAYLASPTSSTFYCYVVTDSNHESATSAADSLSVNSALTPPIAPSVSATDLDTNQPLTVTGTIPSTGTSPYSYEWLYSTGGSYAKATMCPIASGSGASGGTLETCSIPGNSLSPGPTYTFELLVNDSASSAETATSPPSAGVSVNSALTQAAAPAVSAANLDTDQALTVTGTIPSTGDSPYSYEWMFSVGVGYSRATFCAIPGGTGAGAGTIEACSVTANTLSAGSTYTFELLVNDSASTPETTISTPSSAVAVNAALTAPGAPSPGATKLDFDQALAVTGSVPVTGSPPYEYEWLYSTGGSYSKATMCAIPSGTASTAGTLETCSIGANTLTAGTTYTFELLANDSATVPETKASAPSSGVAVSSALLAPAAPVPSAAKLDRDQALSVSANVPNSGASPYQWEWLFSTGGSYSKATMCGTPSGNGATSGVPETCSIAANVLTAGSTYTFELLVNDSATVSETKTSGASSGVVVGSALLAPTAPTPNAAKLDRDQALTVTANVPNTGTSPYQWEWLFSTGGSYSKATMCGTPSGNGATSGALETCSIAANTLTAGSTYTFELLVNDSATVAETKTSAASSSVVVSSALLAPAAPVPSAAKLDRDQALSATANIPTTGTSPYQWEWLFSTGGSYSKATMCGTPSGSGASAGALETCSITANVLTAGSTYTFELVVNDSATVPETRTSAASSGVAVSSALLPPSTPAPGAAKLDRDQALSVTANVPSTGTAPYQWEWLFSTGGSYSKATMCGTPSGNGATTGAFETCSIPANTLAAGLTYTFELLVNDSATTPETKTSSPSSGVVVSSALLAPAAPAPSATKLDRDQALTITADIPTTGTSPFQWEWQFATSGSYSKATMCAVPSGTAASAGALETCSIAANVLTVGSTYTFELLVNDSASAPETATSPASSGVLVSSALIAPSAPSVTATSLDANQTLAVTDSIPSTGSAPYQYEWLYSTGGSYSKAAMCGLASNNGQSAGAPETCTIAANSLTAGTTYTFEFLVNDSATSMEFATSSASSGVVVSSALTAPGIPTPGGLRIDSDQPLSVTGTVPSTGTPPYQYEWLFSTGGVYSKATMCSVASASGVSGGTLETCSISANVLTAGSTYTFELLVNDSATVPESQTSSPSSGVVIGSPLTVPAAPTTSAAKLDLDQALTVTGTIPSSGTSPYQWEWLFSTGGSYSKATMCGTPGGNGALGAAIETCSIAANSLSGGTTYTFEILVNDSAASPETKSSTASSGVVVSSALVAPGAPTPSGSKLDRDQGLSVTANIPATGTSPYQWEWLFSTGGSYSKATMCAIPNGAAASSGALETCSIAANVLTAGSTYTFELLVNDSATVAETKTSAASSGVVVSSALLAPGAPAPSAAKLDRDQALTVTGTIPSTGTSPYQWEWLFSTGGSYSKATMCGTPSGNGATSGALETCSIAANTLTAGSTYTFELLVNDSATIVETKTSVASSPVVVGSMLLAPSAPTLSATRLDVDQALTIGGSIPSSGSSPYQYEWLYSTGGGYTKATICATPSGSGVAAGAPETCSIAADTLTAGFSYTFELFVNDTATNPESATSVPSSAAVVSTALTAGSQPATSATQLDVDQAVTVSANVPSTGTSPYQWEWLYATGGSYNKATMCATPSGNGALAGALEICSVGANALVAGDTYTFELHINDSATLPEFSVSSPSSGVVVHSALVAPTTPTPSVTSLDADQPLNVSGTIPSSGTASYSWAWLVSVNGGAFASASQCDATMSGNGATPGTVETCAIPGNTLSASSTYEFEIQVTDDATSPETATSPPTANVTTSSALTAGTPSPGTSIVDNGQSILLTANPSGGSGGYTYQWYSGNSSSVCLSAGSPILGAVSSTYSASPTNSTFYCYQVTDSNHVTVASGVGQVTVDSALTAPSTPVPSATALDVDQPLTVSATIPATGTPPYSWEWLTEVNGEGGFVAATQCSLDSGSGALGGSLETCTVASDTLVAGDTYAFELQVRDGATSPEVVPSPASVTVVANSQLTAPLAPVPSSTALDADQVLVVAGTIPSSGTSTYAWQWLVSVNGQPYAPSSLCTLNSATGALAGSVEHCTIAASSLTVGNTYLFEFRVTDSATNPETTTSAASPSVTVSSALTTPSAPTVSATALDLDQALVVTGTIPSTGTSSYSWQWYESLNGAVAVAATQCAFNGGSGATPGSVETCSIPGGALAAGTTYAFFLQVTDSASSPETRTSAASGSVAVSATLTAPNSPTVSATSLDWDQTLAVKGTIPSTGTPDYDWHWLVSVNGAAYVITTQCTSNGGAGASGGTPEVCSIPGGTLTVGDTYVFRLWVRDSATSPETGVSAASPTVVVASLLNAPTAPSVSATALDADQGLTVSSSIPSTGTSPYAWYWVVSEGGAGFVPTTFCFVNNGTKALGGTVETCSVPDGTLSAGVSYTFKLWVTDNASTPETRASSPSPTVAVNAALMAPAVPNVSASTLDIDQALTVSGTIPSSGTAPYAWQWLVSVNGGAYGNATECGSHSNGTGASAGAVEVCEVSGGILTIGDSYSFELRVGDSSDAGHEAEVSAASGSISVNSALTSPAAPTPSAHTVGVHGSLAVTDTIPSSGTASYSWEWLVSENGSAYGPASQCGSSASGSGVAAGALVTCSIASGTLTVDGTYTFEFLIHDSATTAETVTSPSSSAVVVILPAIASETGRGPVGASYIVQGSGFSPSSGIHVVFGSVTETPVACTVGSVTGALVTTDAAGRFSCTFLVPAVGAGAYPVLGEDVATDSTTSAEQFLVTVPTITLNPPQGTVGAQVTVTGTGFSVSTNLTSLVFESVAISSCVTGSLTTNATGAFSCTFVVPGGTTGTTVTATDAGGQASTTTFRTMAPSTTSGFPFLWVAVVAALAATALLAVLVLRRRHSGARARRPAAPVPEEPIPEVTVGPVAGPPVPTTPTVTPATEPGPVVSAAPIAGPRRPGFERRIPGRRAEYPPEPALIVPSSRGSTRTTPSAEAPSAPVSTPSPPAPAAETRGRRSSEPTPATPSKSMEDSLGDLAAAFASAPPLDSSLPLDRPVKSTVRFPEEAPPAAPSADGSWKEVDMVLADLESISKQILSRPAKKPDEAEANKGSENQS